MLQVRELPPEIWWRVTKAMQHAGQYFEGSPHHEFSRLKQQSSGGKSSYPGVGVLKIFMSDGQIQCGVGCLYGWNTVLTCAHILLQKHRKAVKVLSFTVLMGES